MSKYIGFGLSHPRSLPNSNLDEHRENGVMVQHNPLPNSLSGRPHYLGTKAVMTVNDFRETGSRKTLGKRKQQSNLGFHLLNKGLGRWLSGYMSTHCSPRGPKICCQHPRQTITSDFCRHWYPCVHTSYPIHIIKNNKKKIKNRRKKSENRWVRYLGSRTKPNYVYDYANCKQPKTVI